MPVVYRSYADRVRPTLHVAPVVVTNDGPPLRPGAVAVQDGAVVAVGEPGEVAAEVPGARTRDWDGILTPGLVNAHTHLQYTAFADLATLGLPFTEWIRRMSARRRDVSDAAWAESTRTGVFLALRSGTTTVADVVSDPAALAPVVRSGLGGVSYLEAVAYDEDRWARSGRDRLVRCLTGAAAGRRLGVSPHAVYTLSGGAFADACRVARERGLRVHPHLAETVDEVELVALGTGRLAALNVEFGLAMPLPDGGAGVGPAEYVDSLGGLGPDVHVAHGTHLDAADRALLRARGTAVALCVRSNRVLHVGRPPVAAYLAEGSPLALGTDSLASCPSLDLLEEARAARDLARAEGYDAADLDRRVVEAATLGGARALGLDDVGVLRPGARADLAVFAVPTDGDPFSALVDHGAGECVATVLEGRLVHRR